MANKTRERATAVRDALYDHFPAAEGWAIDVHGSGMTMLLTASHEGRTTSFATGGTRRSVPAIVAIFTKAIEDMETLAPSADAPGPLSPRGSALGVQALDGAVRLTVAGEDVAALDTSLSPSEALDLAERLTRAARIALRA